MIMGERAAARANSTLDKCLVSTLSISSSLKLPAAATPRISGMYVGKNVGVSRAVGNNLEKVFGKKAAKDEGPAAQPPSALKCQPSSSNVELDFCHDSILQHIVIIYIHAGDSEDSTAKTCEEFALKRVQLVWRFSGQLLQQLAPKDSENRRRREDSQNKAAKVVVAVVPGGAGEAAAIQPGQAIFEINGRQMIVKNSVDAMI